MAGNSRTFFARVASITKPAAGLRLRLPPGLIAVDRKPLPTAIRLRRGPFQDTRESLMGYLSHLVLHLLPPVPSIEIHADEVDGTHERIDATRPERYRKVRALPNRFSCPASHTNRWRPWTASLLSHPRDTMRIASALALALAAALRQPPQPTLFGHQ